MKQPQKKPLWKNSLFGWAAGYALLCAAVVLLVYYWRVFYYFDRFSPVKLTVLVWAAASALYAVLFFTVRFVHSLAGRTALLLAAAGLCFCFINPPLQTPDEGDHFLRAYAISLGRLNFDAERGYPADVDLLMESFPGAYTNANNGASIKQYYHLTDDEDPESEKIADGAVRSIADSFTSYRTRLAQLKAGAASTAEVRTEPLVVMVLPYLPQALGMVAARLLGASALGCLYGGRIVNLLVYAALAYLALRGLKRWQGVFLAVLFLPLSLYMAASLSYDAQLLGLYALAASLLLREEFTQKHLIAFILCVALINVAKPWINLLWIPGLLFIAPKNWKARLRPWAGAALALAAAVAVTLFCTWYGRTFRFNYGDVGRMLGESVNGLQQLSFVLHNPLRTFAVLWGTLYENTFFLPGLGNFGALDTLVPAVGFFSVLLLAAGTFSAARQGQLSAKTNLGLGCFALIYSVGVMMALYITYTPVGMVRVIGLQARYFLPAVLLGLVLAAQGIGKLAFPGSPSFSLAAAETSALPKVSEKMGALLPAGFLTAVLSALLLFETYFIGPIVWTLSELTI